MVVVCFKLENINYRLRFLFFTYQQRLHNDVNLRIYHVPFPSLMLRLFKNLSCEHSCEHKHIVMGLRTATMGAASISRNDFAVLCVNYNLRLDNTERHTIHS